MTRNVAVVGDGPAGRRLAVAAFTSGAHVVLAEVGEEGRAALDAALVEQGVDPDRRPTYVEAVGDLDGVEVVVDATDADAHRRGGSLATLERRLDPSALLLAVDVTGSLSAIAAQLDDPGRLAGVHPVHGSPLVEVVRGLVSREDVVAAAAAFVQEVGLEALVVAERPGLLVERLRAAYLNHAVDELDGGLAAADDIDLAVRLGLGYPDGPYELLDRLGLDRHLATTTALHEATGDARLAPPPLLRRLAAVGRVPPAGDAGRDARGGQDRPGGTDRMDGDGTEDGS